ncbi:MAG: hypothetical protein U0892_00165 [Pirellulales bacterium]
MHTSRFKNNAAVCRVHATLAICLLFCFGTPAIGQSPPDEQLGSTLTAEQFLNPTPSVKTSVFHVLRAAPAMEPKPALKIRFTPTQQETRPGSAMLHFSRALVILNQISGDLRKRVDSATAESPASKEDLKALVAAATHLFHELHLLGLSEDQSWDHRLRDLNGTERWTFLLPEVQEGRSLARLLQHRVEVELEQKNVAGAVEAVQDGFRLSTFMAQGETVIQQLVSLAIETMMMEATEKIIAEPHSDNFYWAIASLRDPQPNMRRAFELELYAIKTTFQPLLDAKTLSGDEEFWQKKVLEMQDAFRQLSGDSSIGLNLSLAVISSAPSAKEKLIAQGYKAEMLDQKPRTQLTLLQAGYEIDFWCDEINKEFFLPADFVRNADDFASRRLDKWMQANRHSSVSAVVMSLLVPSFEGIGRSLRLNQVRRERLLIVEALRHYAATHDGKLPQSLAQLTQLPAPTSSPFGKPWEYEVTDSNAVQAADISLEQIDVPNLRRLRLIMETPAAK